MKKIWSRYKSIQKSIRTRFMQKDWDLVNDRESYGTSGENTFLLFKNSTLERFVQHLNIKIVWLFLSLCDLNPDEHLNFFFQQPRTLLFKNLIITFCIVILETPKKHHRKTDVSFETNCDCNHRHKSITDQL